jgi:hypothetical protein
MSAVKYNVYTGVMDQPHAIRRTIAAITATIAMSLAVAIPALAAGPGYDANPGRQQAVEVGAQCGTGAGSGAFGALGKDNSMAGGANGAQTGLNNSAVCGNRQGNL